MSDAAIEGNLKKDKPAPDHVDAGAWVQGADHGVKPGAAQDVPKGFPAAVTITGLDGQNEGGRPIVGKGFDAAKIAADINDALHPAFFSWRTGPDGDRVWNDLMNLSPDEYKLVEREFNTRHAPDNKPLLLAGDGPWTLAKDIKLHLSADESNRLAMLMESKNHNDVDPQYRVNGEQLLKPGSNLKVGEMNHVSLPDGRKYDVYVPKNADSRGPVIVAMHGAAGGDSVGLMPTESGLTADAERTGATVVFAYPKVRDFDSKLGTVQGVAWNAPDRTNLPSARDGITDDRKYLDNVLDDLAGKSQTTQKVGLYGFSDGGRFAQVYAADRPDRVSGVVSADGTWMDGDRAPTVGKAVMIIHGDNDATLPQRGGTGSVSSVMDWLLGTNLDKSAPLEQARVWSRANSCDGPVVSDTRGDVTTRVHEGCSAPLVEYTLKGGNHAINDYKNGGNHFVQWLLGSPDRSKAFSTMGAAFLKENILRDLSQPAPKPRPVPPT
ncbi:MAG: dienelactone hydrolase family protein [Cyanobacteria bacterium SZAS LIN-2]|nr:dienelactone hydrolase family protein [Cyanobacteria bacterium SZAS LIN-2]